jgi:thiamine biosynthesis lipoprotein
MIYRIYCIGILSVFAISCTNKNQAFTNITGKAQGTTYSITFEDKKKLSLQNEIDSIFTLINNSMSLWDSTSLISKFNKVVAYQKVDEHFLAVLNKSKAIYAQSDGAFDPTVGALVKSWGFIRKKKLMIPSQQAIDSLLKNTGFDKVSSKGSVVFKENPNIQLDFNAIAQGYTVDVLAAQLEKHGIKNYMIELGGEITTKGKNKEGNTWRIGIEKPIYSEPVDEQNTIQNILGITNKSLATSGSYRNFIEKDGKRYSHIINPKTGKPVEHTILSVSVLARTCAEADAWATAFMVLGQEKSLELARKYGLEIQIILFENDNFEVVQTEGFKKLIIQTP